MPLQTATPRDEGRWAYYQCAEICECPHLPHTYEARDWMEGWIEADEQAREPLWAEVWL